MSDAWEGYHEERRRSRRRKPSRTRRWMLAALAGAALAAAGVLVAQHRSQGQSVNFGKQVALRAGPRQADSDLAAVTLVVFNESDPLSRDLAKFYAGKRGIPRDQVVGLKCPTEEEISREDYDNTVAGPLRAVFDARGWWTRSSEHTGTDRSSDVTQNRIRFVVLMRGMPLKIRPATGYEGDPGNSQPTPIHEQNAASVDSELAVLGYFTRAISGVIPNPYFREYGRITEDGLPRLMLVTRLDAPTASMVERMIDDSLAAEKNGLWGMCYLDGRGFPPGSSPLAEGDAWITKINTETTPYILPTVFDQRPEMFSREYPMTDTAFYFGWYSADVAGPFTRPEFRFEQGAVACHLHSYSAVSVRDPAHHWVGPLLDRGAAATIGNVYEPYLTLTTHMDILAARLCDGYTLAESAYAATPGLSWMNVVIGDPLYRPGKALQDLSADLTDPPATGDPAQVALITEGRAYWRGAQTWRASGAAAGGKALEKSGRALHSGRIYEGLGLLRAGAGDVRGACAAFDQAMAYYKYPPDVVRAILDEGQALADAGRKTEAVGLLRKHRPLYANQVVGASLDQLIVNLGGTP